MKTYELKVEGGKVIVEGENPNYRVGSLKDGMTEIEWDDEGYVDDSMLPWAVMRHKVMLSGHTPSILSILGFEESPREPGVEDFRAAVENLNAVLYREDNPYPLEFHDTCTGVWAVSFMESVIYSSENDYLKEVEDDEGNMVGWEQPMERLKAGIGKIVSSMVKACWNAEIEMENIYGESVLNYCELPTGWAFWDEHGKPVTAIPSSESTFDAKGLDELLDYLGCELLETDTVPANVWNAFEGLLWHEDVN